MQNQHAFFALLIYPGESIIGCHYGECDHPFYTIERDYLRVEFGLCEGKMGQNSAPYM
jgi:hypothetical protein